MFDLVSPWQEVLDYWFEDGIERGWPSEPAMRKWFRANAGDDAEIEHRFAPMVDAALQQELVDWDDLDIMFERVLTATRQPRLPVPAITRLECLL